MKKINVIVNYREPEAVPLKKWRGDNQFFGKLTDIHLLHGNSILHYRWLLTIETHRNNQKISQRTFWIDLENTVFAVTLQSRAPRLQIQKFSKEQDDE